uniref:Sororin C-terminal region domain-containing protein n=1 Tax=Davidia involucrata TaxID=16924 RepID=A0A5B7AXR9_DAVIN
METERSSRSVKRKPLSDRTNLIPTTTLRNLSSSSSLFAKPTNPNPIPKLYPKPYISSTNKPETNSSKSDTSVGSSTTNKNNAPNPRTVAQPQASTPPRIPPLHSSSTNPGNGNNEIFGPLVVYSRRQTVEKTRYKGKAVAVPFSCPPLDKTKDKRKTVAASFSCPPLEKAKGKGKAIAAPFSCPPLEKTKDKGKAVAVASLPPPENTKNKGKAVAVSFSCPPPLRTRNIRDELNEAVAVDIGISKSCTVPHPRHKKKRRCLLTEQDDSVHALPQDFIEQQKAYFKEVDEFELPEDEVSYNEMDK